MVGHAEMRGRVGAMAIAFAEGSMVTGRPPGFHEAGGP